MTLARRDPRRFAAPCVVDTTWNGRPIREIRIEGQRYYTLADAAPALGLGDSAALRMMIARHPMVGDASVLLSGEDARDVDDLLTAFEERRNSPLRRSAIRDLRLLTVRGMIVAWSMTEAGQREVVERFAASIAEDPSPRRLVDFRGQAGTCLTAPWETPAYLADEAKALEVADHRARAEALEAEANLTKFRNETAKLLNRCPKCRTVLR